MIWVKVSKHAIFFYIKLGKPFNFFFFFIRLSVHRDIANVKAVSWSWVLFCLSVFLLHFAALLITYPVGVGKFCIDPIPSKNKDSTSILFMFHIFMAGASNTLIAMAINRSIALIVWVDHMSVHMNRVRLDHHLHIRTGVAAHICRRYQSGTPTEILISSH